MTLTQSKEKLYMPTLQKHQMFSIINSSKITSKYYKLNRREQKQRNDGAHRLWKTALQNQAFIAKTAYMFHRPVYS